MRNLALQITKTQRAITKTTKFYTAHAILPRKTTLTANYSPLSNTRFIFLIIYNSHHRTEPPPPYYLAVVRITIEQEPRHCRLLGGRLHRGTMQRTARAQSSSTTGRSPPPPRRPCTRRSPSPSPPLRPCTRRSPSPSPPRRPSTRRSPSPSPPRRPSTRRSQSPPSKKLQSAPSKRSASPPSSRRFSTRSSPEGFIDTPHGRQDGQEKQKDDQRRYLSICSLCAVL